MSITGTELPTKVGVPIADLIAGMNGAYGVLAALHERERTGRGRVVRTSLLAGMVGVHAFQGTRWTVAGEVPGLAGDHHPSIAPYGMFATATAPIQIACGSEGLWRAFCAAFELDAADPRFATNADRVGHRDELIEVIEALFADRTAEDCLAALAEAGVPSGKVRTLDDVYDWEQTRSQGLLVSRRPRDARDPRAARLADPLRRRRALRRPAHPPGAPPTLDQHGDAIREWLDSDRPEPRSAQNLHESSPPPDRHALLRCWHEQPADPRGRGRAAHQPGRLRTPGLRGVRRGAGVRRPGGGRRVRRARARPGAARRDAPRVRRARGVPPDPGRAAGAGADADRPRRRGRRAGRARRRAPTTT